MTTLNVKFFMPTKLYIGKGSLNLLGKLKLPYKKVLVVTSGAIMTQLGYVGKVQTLLKEAGIESIVYDKVQPNPITTHVMEAAEIVKENGCDAIVGLGGGSSIDSAKAISVMSTNEGNLWDYAYGSTGKEKEIKCKPLPVIAIPTIAGTGTEADPWSVITNPETYEKTGLGTEEIFPVMSFVDAELMKSIPPLFTAYQGMDAFLHAAEGYIAKVSNEISDIFALKSISLISANLPLAYKDGNNIKARENMALASTLSGIVESTSDCTSEHALGQAFAAFNDKIPHGASLIIICREYFKHFSKLVPQKFIDMAKAMGKTEANSPNDFLTALDELLESCDLLNVKMSDFGIKKHDLKKYVDNARTTLNCNFEEDPVPLSDEQALSILEKSYR